MDKPIQIQHLDEETAAWLDERARRRGVDVERIVIEMIHRGIESEHQAPLQAHHDLDALAGTWSPEEAEEFFRATSGFGEIDEGLWR